MKWLVLLGLFISAKAFVYDAPENCEWKLRATNRREVVLNCDVRTLNANLSNKLDVADSDYTVELNVKCSEQLFFQSAIEPRTFQKLHNLDSLAIEHCKFSQLPGGTFLELDRLRKLSLITYNVDWSSMKLDLASESFIGMPNLESLDISRNNIWELPPRIFCPLPALRHLNLTGNRLQEISEIGAAGGCGAHLVSLDLSGNNLVIMPEEGVAGLKSLKQLHLQYNSISLLADSALRGMHSLEILNISSNQLAALPPKVFNESKRLRQLFMQNNTISVLSPGLFSSLSQLTMLDLSRNHLSADWISSETFEGLVRLIVLNLSRNRLDSVHEQMFGDLSALQSLDLSSNELTHISDGTFSKLANLHRLDLSSNKLSVIGGKSLAGLHVLSTLFIANNNITQIESATFENCSSLRELNLDFNGLTRVPEAVSLLTSIKSLRITNNLLTVITNTDFTKLKLIKHLDLSNNFIRSLSTDSFLGLSELSVLDLNHNKIDTLSPGTFDTNYELELLRLDANNLNDMNGLFASLSNLVWLNVSDNNIKWFDYGFIPNTLSYLDLRQNQIEELGNYFGIESKLRLRSLDVSHNFIKVLGPLNVPNSIELLLVNSNRIENILPGTFTGKTNLSMVDLYDNLLTNITLSSISLSPVPEDKPLPEFYIGGNPVFCDCKMEWLHRIHQISALRQHPRIMDLDKVPCTLAYTRSEYTRVPFLDSHPSQFLCLYEKHCFALCQCCDFIACDCQMTCPDNCSCYHDDTWGTNIVDCSERGHKKLPEGIPMDATVVYLDGNNITVLEAHLLIGRKNLRTIYLNNSNIEIIDNRTFHGLSSLKVLHLEDNLLLDVRGFEFKDLEHLRELHLQNNRITSIDIDAFSRLRSLEKLNLANNFLFDFPVWELNFNKVLNEVHLSRNPWSCNCDFTVNFQSWQQTSEIIVADSKQLICSTNSSRTRGPKLLESASSCKNYIATSIVQKNTSHAAFLTPVLITLAFFFVILVIGVLFTIYRIRWRKRNSQKCSGKWPPPETTERKDKNVQHDIFVAHSELDSMFVKDCLAKELENNDPCYKVCLATRDYEAVSSYVGDFIINSVETSRQVIVVLSNNFINEWGKYVFKATHLAAIRNVPNLIVIVLDDDLSEQTIDPDLTAMIKGATKIRFNDKNFWIKLRGLLPPPSKKVNRPCFITETNYMIRNNISTLAGPHPTKKGQLIPNMVLNGGVKATPNSSHHSNLSFEHPPKILHPSHHHVQHLGPGSFLQQTPTHHHHPNPVNHSVDSGDTDRSYLHGDQSSLNHSYMSLDYMSSRNSHIYASIEDPPAYPTMPITSVSHIMVPASTPVQQNPQHCRGVPQLHHDPSVTRPYTVSYQPDGNILGPSYFI